MFLFSKRINLNEGCLLKLSVSFVYNLLKPTNVEWEMVYEGGYQTNPHENEDIKIRTGANVTIK